MKRTLVAKQIIASGKYPKNVKPHVMIVIATDIIGGPGKGLFQFLRFADRRKFDFMLCNYDRSGRMGFRNDFLDKAKMEGIPVHRFFQRATFDPMLVIQALRIIRKKRIDIVQTHSYKSNVLGCLLKCLFGIPWIAFAHGYTDENKKISIYNRLDLWCFRFADLAVVVSEPLKRLLQANHVNPHHILKLPNAVDRGELVTLVDRQAFRKSLSLGADNPVIAVIGRMSPEKGHLVFLEAFHEAKAKIPDLQVLLIGDGQEKPRLIQFCKEYRLSKDVIFTGHVNNISDYYHIIDLLVIPSFSEGLPNVLLEAMSTGVPVVSTRVGAVGEVLDGMDLNMVAPGNSHELAERIVLFLRDGELVRKTVEQGRRIVAMRYDPARRAEKLVSQYYRVLSAVHENML